MDMLRGKRRGGQPGDHGWALLHPLDRHLPVFPYATTSPTGWALSATCWITLSVCAAAVLGAVLADARWWRLPRP